VSRADVAGSMSRGMFVDRLDVDGRARKHRTDDGARTLCGLRLTLANARLPTTGIECARCLRLAGRPRFDALYASNKVQVDPMQVLQCLSATIAAVDGDTASADRALAAAVAPVGAILSTIMELREASQHVCSRLLHTMAIEVIAGNRTLADLRQMSDGFFREPARRDR